MNTIETSTFTAPDGHKVICHAREVSQREWCEMGIEKARKVLAQDEAAMKRARGYKRTILAEGIASMKFIIGQYEAELAGLGA